VTKKKSKKALQEAIDENTLRILACLRRKNKNFNVVLGTSMLGGEAKASCMFFLYPKNTENKSLPPKIMSCFVTGLNDIKQVRFHITKKAEALIPRDTKTPYAIFHYVRTDEKRPDYLPEMFDLAKMAKSKSVEFLSYKQRVAQRKK